MEGLAGASGVIAVVSLAGQVVQGCSYIRGIFEGATTAPEEIHLLTTELGIIERIVEATPGDDEHRDALDFCNEAVAKLRNVVDKYAELDGVGRYRKWSRRLSMALTTDKIQKHLGRLKAAKTYIQDLQNQSAHSLTFAKSLEVQQSISQLNNSYVESATILGRTEGRIEELSKMTRETQLALHEFAGRIINRAQDKSIREEQYIQRIETKLIEFFSEHIRGAVASPNSPITRGDNVVENPPVLSSRMSELDQRLADLFNGPSTNKSREIADENTPEMEKASKYKTWLGEVYMRAITKTYTSASEISKAALPAWSCFMSEPIKFPITMTKTEILLLPMTWGLDRGATIECHHLSGTSTEVSDITFEILAFGAVDGVNHRTMHNSRYMNRTSSTEMSRPREVKKILSNTSQSLLYTAFRATFLATNLCKSGRNNPKGASLKTPIPRSSFDEEINDIVELVHLWVNSGLEADFFKDAFSSDTTTVRQQSELVSDAANRGLLSLETVRHQYMLRLVVEMTAKCSGEDWLEG